MNCVNHPNTTAVHYCRTCGKPICSACSRDVMGVIYCEPCLAERLQGVQPPPVQPPTPGYAPPAAGFVSPAMGYVPPLGAAQPGFIAGPNPALAGLLAGIFPFGVGAVYCGQYIKGLVHLGIFVSLIIAESSGVPWYVHMMLGMGIAFFYVFQIVDSVRTAHALLAGQPIPDPFGLSQAFGPIQRNPVNSSAKMPVGAIVLIVLGGLFLLNTLLDFDINNIWPLFLIGLGFWMFARRWGIIPAQIRGCQCDRCRSRGITGPVIMMTAGMLWLLDEVAHIDWGHSWPVLLIVIGLLKVWQSNASSTGHTTWTPAQPGAPAPPVNPVAPMEPPQTPPSEVTNG
ncbi:MAG TPA: B-box zinc finger protein [Terriglobales bacterium]